MKLYRIGMLIVLIAAWTNIFLALVLDISMAKYPWIHFIYWPICFFGLLLMLRGHINWRIETKESEERLNKRLKKGVDNSDELKQN